MHSVGRVLGEVSGLLSRPPAESVPVLDSLGRYSAETVVSSFKLPPAPKSVVDGYAVRAEDVEPASPGAPVTLRLLEGVLRPGSTEGFELPRGSAVRVETGALLPVGADAVVPVEDALEEDGRVHLFRRVARYENVSLPGEEYEEGVPIVRVGDRIQPHHLSALVLEGRSHVNVFRVEASILNVGDEIVGGTYFRPFTHFLVASWLRSLGFRVTDVSVAPDSPEAVAEWAGSRGEWLVVILGGTSMGGHDFTVKALESLGPEYIVHGLALQPGKTACVAVKGGRLYLAASGLPVAALSTLEVFLRPLLRRVGLKVPLLPRVKARLTRRITVKAGVVGFARVRVYREGGTLLAEPVMLGGSGALASLLRGNGYVIVPEGLEGYDEGEEVEVHLYGEVEE
ncbi:molybdopterin molybdotransferase MoeA [Thermofilum pendens]|uniref:MoeA domain protein, domain I and II n=1 Tax=Thermofilum pendens (strain DSM 2475 / Hrk 5) TaxID=368408 RepID=A1RZ23_THEPD|nr:molybdopterin molybdotransferase MoeA [Thermofilum pendens]ABL78453.1 MoeA domain protein, domain I and II [Thermofilum pendens Hrk 5]